MSVKEASITTQLDETQSTKSPSPLERLNKLQQRANAVYSESQEMALKKKQQSEEKIRVLQTNAISLEKNLVVEANERLEQGQKFQAAIERKVETIQTNFYTTTQEETAKLVPILESNTRRFVPIERDVLEKELVISRLDENVTLLAKQIELYQQTASDEIARRTRAEEEMNQKLDSLFAKLNSTIMQRNEATQTTLDEIKTQIETEDEKHTSQKTNLVERINNESQTILSAIETEKNERESEEERVVSLIEEIYSQFQEGMQAFQD
ncbi:hypothetical protein BLNAU_12890 [Blattamonas nauphoetae]|uniref:Uncharacterized protein n=1 Tax=Blattamonas nauphoetae TaxID=2049346 RepID=A0ABQ9XLE4_9EUKA|nr:hypothetical protein BLNAU_12890 [Blattamonas nauphoetae]